MAVSTLVATAGSATANTYCTLAVADQYHEDRPAAGTTWDDAIDAEKNAALLFATKLLERYFIWNGYVVDATQALLWPRLGLIDLNGLEALDHLTIPDEIQWATAELARQLLVSDRTGDSDVVTQGITLIKAGSVRIDFDGSAYTKPIPDIVYNLIPIEWGYVRGYEERELLRA